MNFFTARGRYFEYSQYPCSTAGNDRYRGMKRTVQVNVKMTQEDFNLLRKAADRRWPDAVITNSGIVLAFAKIAAREVLAKKK